MKNYTKKDFSPIFGPYEKPNRPGWYITNHCDIGKTFNKGHSGKRAITEINLPFAHWNGKYWTGLYGNSLITRGTTGRWFGLNHNPKKK